MAAVINKDEKSAQENAEIAIAELRSQYAEKMREQYESAAEKLRAERDEALRESWVMQQQAEAALPEQMAAAGMNGGASETNIANMKAQYQGERNDIKNVYIDELGELGSEQNAKQAEVQAGYNEKWLDYLLSLAKKEKDYEYEKMLG